MKKIYLSLTLLLLTIAGFSQTSTYQGNGLTGFGGPVGPGNLVVNFDGTNLNFTLNCPAASGGTGGNGLVIYIDNGSGGGFVTNAGFTDFSSGITKAISGYTNNDNSGDSGRALINFVTGFAPQYAIGMAGFSSQAELVQLVNGPTLTEISMPTQVGSGPTYEASFTPAQLGLTGTAFTFHFMATLVSGTGYRANEAIGMNFPSTQGNFGWIGNGAGVCNDTTASLVFTASALPITLGNFNGILKNQSVNLSWTTKSESALNQFEVQKSTNGTTWNTIGSVTAKNIVSGSQYAYVDNGSISDKNFYRLKIMNKNASFSYSPVIIVYKNSTHQIAVLGNPVSNVINLNISDDAVQTYQLSLYSSDGRMLTSQVFNHPGGTSKATVNVPSGANGICLLKVSTGAETQTFRIMVQQ